MKYAVIFGSDIYIGTTGVLGYEDNKGKVKEFFTVREVYRERSDGSYLALNVDIKDIDGSREVKLFKSKPVVESPNVIVKCDKKRTTVTREDGTIVIDIEQLDPSDPSVPQTGPMREMLNKNQLEAVIRVTGNFAVGDYKVKATTENIQIGGMTIGGNLSVGTGGLVLRQMGISFG
jgi:hypothetical protein